MALIVVQATLTTFRKAVGDETVFDHILAIFFYDQIR
jgi:hypothetical protein